MKLEEAGEIGRPCGEHTPELTLEIERSSPWNSPDRVGGSGSDDNNNSLKGVWRLSALNSDDVGGGMRCWAAPGAQQDSGSQSLRTAPAKEG
jgi:hypothetical protein